MFFLYKHMASLQKAFINPWSRMDLLYDGWMHFFGLFTPIMKLGRSRVFYF